MILNYDIVDIEKLDGLCLPTVVVYEFFRLHYLYIHQSFLLNIQDLHK